jgi:hypothetical protein
MSRFVAWFAGVACVFVADAHAAPVPAGNAGSFKPTVTVRVAPLDQILGDVRYTARLMARLAPSEKEAKEFADGTDEQLKKLLAPDWRNGIDTVRPIFGFATIDEKLGTTTGALMIPVKDEAAFHDILKRLTGKVTDGPDGLMEFEVSWAGSVSGVPAKGFARMFNRYAYLTLGDPAAIEVSRVPAPDQIQAGDPTAAVSAHLWINRIPEALRQQAITGVQQARSTLDAGRQGPAPVWGITIFQVFLLGGPMFQLLPLAEPAIRDGQELALNLRYDRKHLNLESELVLTAKPGSELTRLIAPLKTPISLFPELLGPEMAGRGILRSTIPESIRKQLDTQLQSGLAVLPQADPTWGGFAAKIVESLLPTLREGEFDLAAGLAGPGKDDHYSVVAGLRVKDGAGVEKGFRDAVKSLPEKDRALFKLDAATAGGVKVNQFPLPVAALKPIFGESVIQIAFGQDRIVVSFGDGGLPLLEKALKAKSQPLPRTFIEVSAQKLVPLVTKIDADAGKKFKTFLGTEIDQVTLLQVAVEGGSTLKLRYGNVFTSLAPLGLFAFRAVGVPVP